MSHIQGSIWYQGAELPAYPAWAGEGKADVVVIGGGMTGVLVAFLLKEAGRRVILVEAERVGSGQTGRTTAKITSQHGVFYGKYLDRLGEERMRAYAVINQQAIRSYQKIVQDHDIRCDWKECDSYLYTTGVLSESRELLEREYRVALQAGIDAELCEGDHMPGKSWLVGGRECMALRFSGQAHFHPLKFLQGVLPGLEVYEHSRVEDVEDHRVWVSGGKEGKRSCIEAEKIVFACHYPFLYRPGYYFLRLHQERSYVLAIRSGRMLKDLYYPLEEGLSVRPYGQYLLLSGAGHRTGEVVEDPYGRLRQMASDYDPDYQEVCHWSAQDTVSLDELPYIGVYSSARPNWYVATGYKKWGMTQAMVAAELLSEQITGFKRNGYAKAEELVAPARFLLSASASHLAEESLQVASGLAKSITQPPRCTHLGCSLVWNAAEGSWDCPCHGSRFQPDGQVLDGPAQRPIMGADD